MARLSFLSLLALTLVGVSSANSIGQQEALVPVHTQEGWDWTDCGLATDPIQIESIHITPDPPKPGKDLTVLVKAIAQHEVQEGAYADVTVKLGLIKLLQKQFDVCEEARNANASVRCPVEKGYYEVEQTVALPKEIPQAKFTISVRGYTVDDDSLVCLDLKVDFMKKPFPLSKFGW
ncbi:hypothetical protein EW146_g762 [Bondarzewia mesenterica]|uniref:Phosphatidylglycerol/phosphatidylinositol transfer protein n=1 Tax=Bondarzewia mesenterica TaxID=1095465 RepID=A0A4S4M6F7_9AGAM|nr:hypothetical protein EW146_g762 [Bondarzewia mesenterica]